MIFELASTWKEGLVLVIVGFLILFVGEYLNYKKSFKK